MKKGFTLMELLMYIALALIIGTVIVGFVPRLLRANSFAQTTEEVLDNSRRAMEIMNQEIQRSSGIYTPTSVFGSSPGQLSLETTKNTPSGEETTFIDFYIDDERLYVKREGSATELLTPEKVRVTNLIFTHLNASSAIPAISISLTAVYDTDSVEIEQQSEITISSTASLRSY